MQSHFIYILSLCHTFYFFCLQTEDLLILQIIFFKQITYLWLNSIFSISQKYPTPEAFIIQERAKASIKCVSFKSSTAQVQKPQKFLEALIFIINIMNYAQLFVQVVHETERFSQSFLLPHIRSGTFCGSRFCAMRCEGLHIHISRTN